MFEEVSPAILLSPRAAAGLEKEPCLLLRLMSTYSIRPITISGASGPACDLYVVGTVHQVHGIIRRALT